MVGRCGGWVREAPALGSSEPVGGTARLKQC
jgi:hypothetical protein